MAEQDPLRAIAQSCMSSPMQTPVQTVEVTATVEFARKLLSRFDHTGLCVIEKSGAEQPTLVGIVTRRDLEVAMRHGLSQAAVRMCMSEPVSLSASSHSPVPADLYTRLQQRLIAVCPELWSVLRLLATVADSEGWALYLVGGGVRDLLLASIEEAEGEEAEGEEVKNKARPLTDLDLVVTGAEPGAGVRLAEAIQSRYRQVKTQIYGQFQTATLSWPETSGTPEKPEAPSFEIDIATARTEFYPYPAANPEVTSSTIHQDLYRRDFTVNAMALRINSDRPGHLLDFFGGWVDLQQRSLKVIHPNSFIEDPTRIFRAVRFAVRLGFELAPHTQHLARSAIASRIYSQLQASQQKIPALQARLKAELKYLLSLSQWQSALTQLDALGALACIDEDLSLSPQLWKQLLRMGRWQPKFLPQESRWQLMVMLMIAQLSPEKHGPVAARLHLDTPVQQRLQSLHVKETQLIRQLPHCRRPSQVHRQLRSYDTVELLLIVARHPYTLGPQIWHYIVWLSRMPQLINGATLKRLGYQPGPQFREIIATVHQRTLDGELSDAKAAEEYVLAQYPLEFAAE